MSKKNFFKMGVCLVALVLLASFHGMAQAAGKPIVVGNSKGATMFPNPVCGYKGFDADFGVKVEPKVFSAGLFANEALVAGSIDAALGSDTASLGAFSIGAPVRTVMIANVGGDAQAIVAGPGSGITKISDLVGKKVGGTFGTSTHRLLVMVLEEEGIYDKVELFNMKMGDVAVALSTKQIDAGFGWEPWPSLWESKAGGKVIKRGGGYLAATMIINFGQKLIKERPEDCYHLVLAYAKTLKFLRNASKSELNDAKLFVANAWKIDAELLDGVKYLTFDPRFTPYVVQDAKKAAQFMYKIKKIGKLPDVEKFFYQDFINRAMKEHPELFNDL
jgi:ABC-type nitrate/sulfonate/bicarbonate transport system substrate-binding protein